MLNAKKNHIRLIGSVLIVSILLFSGCTDTRKPYKEEIDLPSLHDEDLTTIQRQSYDWFIQRLNPTTGLLESSSRTATLTDQILAGHVLADLSSLNTSFPDVLQHNINSIVRVYEDNTSLFNLSTYSLLLDLIYKTPDETSNPRLEQDLALNILSYYEPGLGFNTTPVLSADAAYGLLALSTHVQKTTNTSIQNNTADLFQYYTNQIEATESDAVNGYFLPWFVPSFSFALQYDLVMEDLWGSILHINSELANNQEKKNDAIIGLYQSGSESLDSLTFQIHAVQSMMIQYNHSQAQLDPVNKTWSYESLILGLIHLKNQVITSNSTLLSDHQQVVLLPIITDIINMFPQDNWSYVWDSSTQTLIEGKTLETSPALWTALTIGVMGSIGLLALVFLIINLYRRYKKQY